MENQIIPTYKDITPYPFQWDVIQNTLAHIRDQLTGKIAPSPAYMDCYVSAGKTIIAGAIADHCFKRRVKLLILARTGELVEQDAAEIFNMGSACSIYSASLGRKSTHYTTVVGTEGTVANALNKEFLTWIPHIILIDECHQINWDDVVKEGETGYSKIINHFKQLNPDLCIIGMTGSPYRGIESIKGPFWEKEIEPQIGRKFLVDKEYIMPTEFGHVAEDIAYDLSEFDSIEEKGTKDFTSEMIEKMHDKMSLTKTQAIMQDVITAMEDRLCALVTCAGAKHCKEASSMVPADEFAIITDKTGKKDRQQILRDAKTGVLNDRGAFRYKYIFQIGCLTTGVNIPLWCTSVLLRRIGSLTLLTQLLGRGMRLLKQSHIDAGHEKANHLVLDYSGTMAAMHQMFDDPMLEDAALAKEKDSGRPLTCPDCKTMNSEYARRCIGEDSSSEDGRCEHFFKSRLCDDTIRGGIVTIKGCSAENDIAARECRKCGKTLIDPNDKLVHKSYGVGDWKPVLKMDMQVTGNNQDAIQVIYHLDSWGEDGKQEVARVNYWAIQAGGKRTWVSDFIRRHINGYGFQQTVSKMNPFAVIKNKAMFDKPTEITHRLNDKGHSIVHGVRFKSGKTMKGNKRVEE